MTNLTYAQSSDQAMAVLEIANGLHEDTVIICTPRRMGYSWMYEKWLEKTSNMSKEARDKFLYGDWDNIEPE